MKKSTKVLIISLPIALAVLLGAVIAITPQNDSNNTSAAVIELKPAPSVESLLESTNIEREKAGVPALILDDRLNQSAQKKADDMNAVQEMSHISPRDGRQGYEYARDAVGSSCKIVSENIYFNTAITNEAVITGWMSSQSHREALLDPKYTNVGFGIHGNYVAQHFCEAV